MVKSTVFGKDLQVVLGWWWDGMQWCSSSVGMRTVLERGGDRGHCQESERAFRAGIARVHRSAMGGGLKLSIISATMCQREVLPRQ